MMSAASIRINNHFLMVDGRKMHYRQAGSGPVVVMLHAAPCSAKVMEPVQKIFAEQFSTIAIDLPGFGLSQQLNVDVVKTEDLADAVCALIDKLGLEQVALYGRHTGAGVAVEFARRHPSRCSMVLTDGFPVFENPYSEQRLDEYLGRITPTWDGAHLLWVWFRYRDLFVFWPWDKRTAGARADTSVPAVDSLHRGALELLEAGNEFRKVYASAFRHAGLKMIAEVKPPVCFGNRPGDSQFHTMKAYPGNAWTKEFPRDQLEAALAERDVLKAHPARSAFEQSSDDFVPGDRFPDIGYVDFDSTQTLVRTSGLRSGMTPTLVLHDVPGSSALHIELLQALGATCPALAIDLLGQGQSQANGPGEIGVEIWSRQIGAALASLGFDRINVIAVGASAAAAVEFAIGAPASIASLILRSPPAFDAAVRARIADRYAVSADPEWDGSHLTRVWHHLRDQELWWPWFERNPENIRKDEPSLDPWQLTLRVRECVKQPRYYKPVWEAVLRYPLFEKLDALKVDTRLVAAEGDLFARFAQQAADRLGRPDVLHLPPDAQEQARVLAQILSWQKLV